MQLIKFQEVYRDAIQSLFGTNPSADEIITAHPNAHLTGVSSIQTGGGTFFDLFAKKRRDEWNEVEKIISFFKALNVRQSALIRGDFVFSYEPQAYDVVRATVFEYAKMGMNILQNFHGMNDARALVGVAKAVKEAQSLGYDIIAQGTICIEDSPNITIQSCLRHAEKLVEMGHQGFYLKSASGRLDPHFVEKLVGALYDRFPDQPITIHVHSTYGEAPICYMAAAKAAVERGQPITMDVQHPSLAGLTAHPSMVKMLELIQDSPIPAIRENAPHLNFEALRADERTLFEMRFRYRQFETPYSHDVLLAMRDARAAGGASATLRSIPGLEDNLGRLLGTNDWNKIQIAIYKMQARIDADLGSPTQVTPYAANTTGQAAISLYQELMGHDVYSVLYPGIQNYLVGRHGFVPESVNPKLQALALEKAGLQAPIDYVLSTDRPPVLDAAKGTLRAAGISEPTDRQAISTIILSNGLAHVLDCYHGKNTPQEPPVLPVFTQKTEPVILGQVRVYSYGLSHWLEAIGGYGMLQKIAEQAVHIKQIDDSYFIFPDDMDYKRDEWRNKTIAALANFFDAVPLRLQEHGVPRFHFFNASAKPSLRVQFIMHDLQGLIKEACDKRGVGVYDHMRAALQSYRRAQPAPDPTAHKMILN